MARIPRPCDSQAKGDGQKQRPPQKDYAVISESVLESDLPAEARLLYAWIDAGRWRARKGYREAARRLGLQARTVRNHARLLRDRGLIDLFEPERGQAVMRVIHNPARDGMDLGIVLSPPKDRTRSSADRGGYGGALNAPHPPDTGGAFNAPQVDDDRDRGGALNAPPRRVERAPGRLRNYSYSDEGDEKLLNAPSRGGSPSLAAENRNSALKDESSGEVAVGEGNNPRSHPAAGHEGGKAGACRVLEGEKQNSAPPLEKSSERCDWCHQRSAVALVRVDGWAGERFVPRCEAHLRSGGAELVELCLVDGASS